VISTCLICTRHHGLTIQTHAVALARGAHVRLLLRQKEHNRPSRNVTSVQSQSHGSTSIQYPHSRDVRCRLDKLRTLVPHAERANTASFLEEVIHYVEELQAILGLAPQQRPPSAGTPMKQPQPMEFNQLYGSAAGSGDFVAAAAAGGGVTSAAYAAIAQQAQQQQAQAQHVQQGNGGMPNRLRELSNLTAEQASVLALQGGLGDYSGAEINEMIANVRREGMTGPSHDGENVGEEIPGGMVVGGNVGQVGRSKRATATGPAAGSQATDSDGSDGRPLKKRVNR